MAAASEELNGAGTPGGGVGRELRQRIGPGNADCEDTLLAFCGGLLSFLSLLLSLPFRFSYMVQ